MRRQPDVKECLTYRETEIITELYQGIALQAMADKLCISLHTLRTHIKNIYGKLNVQSRSGAVYQAVQRGMIQQDVVRGANGEFKA